MINEGMPLDELAGELRACKKLALDCSRGGLLVKGITSDSRQIGPGHLFVATVGEKADGHNFAEEAVRRGAIAVVAQRPIQGLRVPQLIVADSRRALAALSHALHGKPSHRMRTIGVTGTNGKSTVCFLIRSMIESAGCGCGLVGTVEYFTGGDAVRSTMTTPDAPVLHSLMAEMVANGQTHAVMEVSSHALDQGRTDSMRFNTAVFTNLTGDHLDYHRTMKAYRRAKARLFSGLDAGSYAVLNADDPASESFDTEARRVWYGLDPTAGQARRPYLSAEEMRCTLDGSRFRLRVLDMKGSRAPFKSADVEVDMPLVGRHNIYNALAAAGAAMSVGCDLESVGKGLACARPTPGRLEPVWSSGSARDGLAPFRVLVDYAHTHDGLEAVLSAIRPLTRGRLIVVFGAGGDRDRTKRPRMGRAVERWADLAWITSDNPRSEDPLAIIEQICAGIERREKFRKVEDRRLAIEQAILAADFGDVVLIAGKGHETQQIFRDGAIEFDDRTVAREILDRRMRPARASA